VFEQLDEQGRLVLNEAERVAHRLAHHYIGTEHLLVGLAGVEGGSARALSGCGLSAAELEREVAELVGRGRAPITVRPPLTSTAELVLERARWHARQQGRGGVADEDLLLAVLKLADSTATTVLRRLGVDPATIEERLSRVGRSEPVGPVAAADAAAAGADVAHAVEAGGTAQIGGTAEIGPKPAAVSLEALVEDLVQDLAALRREVVLLRAEVARLSLLVAGG